MWIVLCILLFLAFLFVKSRLELKNFPPGLPRVPLLGCVPFLKFRSGARTVMDSVNWIPKYGEIIGLVFGQARMVLIQDFAIAKEVAFSEKFIGKEKSSFFINHIRGENGSAIGIATTDGNEWRHLRRFSLSALKEFGFGKQSSIEAIINEEVDGFLTKIFAPAAGSSEDFLVKFPFNISIFNIIWKLAAGKRFEPDDQRMLKMVEILNEMFENLFLELMFPHLVKILPSRWTGFDVHERHNKSVKEMIRQTIQDHKETRISGQPRDFIDMYLDSSDEDSILTENHLIGILIDFFEAGGETVGSTLSWTLLYLCLYPNEQEVCQREIDVVIGKRERVTLADRALLPRTEAFINEVQRLSCVAAAGLEHQAVEDIKFHGYTIPKGTAVHYNIFRFHMDSRYWTAPQLFRPSRFLAEDEKGGVRVIKKEQFVPFGFGKRVCMGESLAKSELWLFITAILQKFTVEPPMNHPMPNPDEDVAGLTRSPKPFFVHLKSRQQ